MTHLFLVYAFSFLLDKQHALQAYFDSFHRSLISKIYSYSIFLKLKPDIDWSTLSIHTGHVGI